LRTSVMEPEDFAAEIVATFNDPLMELIPDYGEITTSMT